MWKASPRRWCWVVFYRESLGTRRKGIQGNGPGRACGAGAEPSEELGPGRGRCGFAGKNLRSGFYIMGTRGVKQRLTQGRSVPGERPRGDARGSTPRWEGGLASPTFWIFQERCLLPGSKTAQFISDGGVDSGAQRGGSTVRDRTVRGGVRYAAAADSKTLLSLTPTPCHLSTRRAGCSDVGTCLTVPGWRARD